MNWPSQNVPRGGMLHPAKAQYRPETHQFLKVLMEESRLTMMQRNKINYALRNGEPLPNLSSRRRSTCRVPEVTIRPGSPRRRSRHDIISSGAYEREQFRSTEPLIDREKEKDKLAFKMAYNEDMSSTKSKVVKKKVEENFEVNRFDQLCEEIREREEWLQEMEHLDAADNYRLIIEQQIQCKVREMQAMKLEK